MAVHSTVIFRGFEIDNKYDQTQTQNFEDFWAHFRVRIDPFAPQRMNEYPGLAASLLANYPHLRSHACDNGAHKSFASELQDTEVAHALEHLMVELLAEESALSRFDIQGQTAWNFSKDGQGMYRMRIRGFSSEEQARRISQRACIIFEDLSR